MFRTICGLYKNNEYIPAFIWIYHNNEWIKVTGKVYNENLNLWECIGNSGFLYDYFIDANNKILTDSNNNYILVRKGVN